MNKYPVPREYKRMVPDHAKIIPLEDWNLQRELGFYLSENGYAFWTRNGKQSHDDAFLTEPGDATSVAWYEKPKTIK